MYITPYTRIRMILLGVIFFLLSIVFAIVGVFAAQRTSAKTEVGITYEAYNVLDIASVNSFLQSHADIHYVILDYYDSSVEEDSNFTTKITIDTKGLGVQAGGISLYGYRSYGVHIFSKNEIIAPSDCSSMFYYCENLQSITFNNFNTEYVKSMKGMFYNCKNLKTIDFNSFNTENVTDMSDMFRNCFELTDLDLSSFNTENVTNMSRMFSYLESEDVLDIMSFNTKNVTDMSYMFSHGLILDQILWDEEKFVTNNVESIKGMFAGGWFLHLDLKQFNTQKVTDMSYMFSGCDTLKEIFVGDDWTTENVINSEKMFQNCDMLEGQFGESAYYDTIIDATRANWGLEGYLCYANAAQLIDGKSFNEAIPSDCEEIIFDYYSNQASNVEGIEGVNVNTKDLGWVKLYVKGITCYVLSDLPIWAYSSTESMFAGNAQLSKIQFKNFNTYYTTNINGMFYGCSSLTSLDLSSLNTGNVTNMSDMFSSCSSLKELDLSNFNTSNVIGLSSMFSSCSLLEELDLSNFNTANVTNMSSMFEGCSSLKSLNLLNFNTINVTDMSYMFSDCLLLEDLNLSSFNTSNVEFMHNMFSGCASLTSLDLSNFDTGKVIKMISMFEGCLLLEDLNLSSFNTANVGEMQDMFSGCSALNTLDLSSFNTSKLKYTERMFYNCTSLETIYAGYEWNMETVKYSSDMFEGCAKLIGFDGTKYSGYTTSDYAHYGQGGYLSYKNSALIIAGSSFKNLIPSNCETLIFDYYANQASNVEGISGTNVDLKDLGAVKLYQKGTTCYVLSDMHIWANYDCREMFKNKSLKSIQFNNFNTSQVTRMSDMFSGCANLTSLDLSGFDTAKVIYMYEMFYNCTNLKTIYASESWSTAAVKYSTGLFLCCFNLVGQYGTGYDDSLGIINAHYGEGGVLTYKANN